MYSPSSDAECNPIYGSEADVYVDVYKGDDSYVTSGAKLLSDLDLQETYRAIDSVATGRIPSLFCGCIIEMHSVVGSHNFNPFSYSNKRKSFGVKAPCYQ